MLTVSYDSRQDVKNEKIKKIVVDQGKIVFCDPNFYWGMYSYQDLYLDLGIEISEIPESKMQYIKDYIEYIN